MDSRELADQLYLSSGSLALLPPGSPQTRLPPPHIPQAFLLWEGRTRAGPAAVTHLHNIFLEDPIKTQLAHGVDRLPLLGFLGGHQQIGDFYGRERRSLSRAAKV